MYKDSTFSRRTLDEIKADIDTAATMRDRVMQTSRDLGHDGRVTDEVLREVLSDRGLSHSHRHLAAWMYFDEGTVFLQDANSLILKPRVMVNALRYLKERLPEAKRITTYARSATVSKRTVDDLKRLKEAGLDRVHIGLETGFDPLLEFMDKGVTAEQQVQAGLNVKTAGLELSEYVMPGLGGRRWWKEHALATAEVLNRIDPHFIRLRTLRLPDRVDLYDKVKTGDFTPQSDDGTVAEIRLFIETLAGIRSTVASDHIMNLIESVGGKLPEDRDRILAVLDQYLALDPRDRLLYRLCRRMGRCREPADLDQHGLRPGLESALARLEEQGEVESLLDGMADRMV